MRIRPITAAVLALAFFVARPAQAQHVPFERSFEVTGNPKLDISTVRGRIEVTTGEEDRVVVAGTVTVRIGWDVPANALELARKIAEHPPIERDGNTIKLRPPSDSADQRAVTVAYQVRVPRNTDVVTASESGGTTVRGVAGSVVVRTQSGAIEVGGLGSAAEITTGSGAVIVDGVQSGLSVSTSSGGVTGRALAGDVRIQTQSGSVDAAISGTGNVDVQTGSSEIRLHGVKGALRVKTQSGRVDVEGIPSRTWDVSTGSSSITIGIPPGQGFNIEAESRSGSVAVDGAPVAGSVTKRKASGTVGGGGPLVRLTTRSGAIRVTVR